MLMYNTRPRRQRPESAGSSHGQQNRLPDHLPRFVEGVKSAVSNHRLELPRRYPRSASDLPVYEGTHHRRYDMLEMIASYPVLRFAAECVRRNGDTPGIDGETYYNRIQTPGINEFLHDLGKKIRKGKYKFQPLRRIRIPKADGETRLIDIPTISDRIVETAMALVLYQWSSPLWSDCSCGYRPGITLTDVLNRVESITIPHGRTTWLIADVQDAFGSIPHQAILDILGKELPHDGILKMVAHWLRPDSWRSHSGNSKKGIPQGSPLSPFILNLVLDKALDQDLVKESVPFLRYADDLLLPCHSDDEAQDRLQHLKEKLQPWGMKVKERKVIIADAAEEQLPYLGFLLSVDDQRLMLDIDPEQNLRRLKQELAYRAGIRIENDLRDYSVKQLDQTAQARSVIEGWLQHYAPAISSGRLKQVIKGIKATTIRLRIEGISSEWIKDAWKTARQRHAPSAARKAVAGRPTGSDQDSSISNLGCDKEEQPPSSSNSSPTSTTRSESDTSVDTEEEHGERTSFSSAPHINEDSHWAVPTPDSDHVLRGEKTSSSSMVNTSGYSSPGVFPGASGSDPVPANAGTGSDMKVRHGTFDIAASGLQRNEIAQHAVLWSFDGTGLLPDPVQILDPSAPRRPGAMDQDWAIRVI